MLNNINKQNMFIHSVRLAIHNLLQNKAVAAVNIVGLLVGITVSLLVFSFVRKELTTDASTPQIENISVLTNDGSFNFSYKLINVLKDAVPEIADITYCSPDWSPQVLLATEKASYKVEHLLTADSCFFRVFQFKSVWGNPATALNATNRIVLTRSLSKKNLWRSKSRW